YQAEGIFVNKITADGQYQQPGTLLVPQTYYQRSNLEMACVSGVCLLTFNDQATAGAVRFDTNLNVLGGGMFTLLDGAFVDAVVANGSGFYAVWGQQLPNFTSAILGSRLDTNATLLDGTNNLISDATQQGVSQAVLGWDGANWRVAWSISFQTYAARVSAAGQVLDPGGVAVPGVTLGATAVTNNGSMQMVRSEFANNEYDIFTTNVSASFVAGQPVALSVGAPAQVFADSAIGSAGSLVAYRSDTGSAYRLMAQPLDSNGAPLTAEPIQLATGDYLDGPGSPSVAWNGSSYVVTWGQASTVYAQRLQQNGSLLDANPIAVMPGFGPADVEAIGSTYLIVGRQFGITTQIINVYAARLDGNSGAVLDSTPLVVGFNHARSVSLTTMGNRWFMAYQRNFTHDNPLAETKGVFIETNGAVGTEFQVYGYYSVSGGNSMFQVATAASDTTALVVQSAEITSGVETDLIGVIVNSDGTTQPAQNLTPWQGNQYRPHLAWDGAQFVMAYNEQRNRFAPLTLDQLDARSDLYGMRISETGTVIDPQGFIFANSELSEGNPHVAAANGVSLFAGSIFQNGQAAYRIGYQQFGLAGNQWPVAVASADQVSGDVALTVNFSAAGSTDSDGTIASYAWDFGDGTTAATANPSHVYTTPGDYVAVLTVTDNQGATTSNAVAITAMAPNINPVAVINADVTSGPAPLAVVFTAAGSYDPDGTLGNIEWDFGDGSFTYFGSPAYHTFAAEGVYTVTVTVFDSRSGSGSASMVINVGPEPPNQPPIAVAQVNVDTGIAPFNPFFSSANSSDPDGTIAAWLWDFGDGTTSTLPHPAIKVYETPGVYTVTLTVTDNDGATGSDSLTITVLEPNTNQPPVAVANADKTSGSAPLTVRFSSAGSFDPDGSIVAYFWDFGNGSTSTRANPRQRFTSDGTYIVTLTVTDNEGATGSDTVTIVVGTPVTNQPPTAVASADVTSGNAALAVNFSSAGSSDSDGTIVSYSWDFGDGSSASVASPSHTYSAAGNYNAILTVTDDDGATDTATVTITVIDPSAGCSSNCAVVADIRLSVRRNGSLIARVDVVDENGNSLANATVAYTWTLPDGSTVSGTATTSSRGTARINLGNNGSGTYGINISDVNLNGYTFDADNSVLTASITS
ncbi:MAG: PKD domain-containing protein, partial [Anaerolineales bacterium]|nr:PKD domain-containing protein [Anaerolineales bacterium]